MTLSNLVGMAGATLLLGLVAAACSSPPQQPQAFVKVVMSGDSSQSIGLCGAYPSQTTVMEVGMPGEQFPDGGEVQPSRISNGAGSVQISCSVQPTGGSFAINLAVQQGNIGMGAGSFSVSGTVDPVNGGTGLNGNVSTMTAGNYSSSSCTLTFNTPGAGASPVGSPVVGGRIWAHLSCPAAQNPGVPADTKGTPSTCDAEADFIFEFCGS